MIYLDRSQKNSTVVFISMIPYVIPISYFLEYMSGLALQTGNWNNACCCCCQTAFNDNWDRYYTIDINC